MIVTVRNQEKTLESMKLAFTVRHFTNQIEQLNQLNRLSFDM